jgi:transmembrane sensor
MTDFRRSPPASSRDESALKAEAADWFSRQDRGFSPTEAAEFEAWLAADPRHAAAIRQIEASARVVASFRDSTETADVIGEIEARASIRKRRRRLSAFSTVGLAAALVLVFAMTRPRHEAEPAVAVASGSITVKPERRTLKDGSWIELNAGAEFAEEYTSAERTVHLIRGAAYFSVVKDPARPFVVKVGAICVRALGTEFLVTLNPHDVAVAVATGTVAVQRAGPEAGAASGDTSPPDAVLSAGHSVVVPTRESTGNLKVESTPERMQSAQAWRSKRVQFSEVPLRQIVEIYNRQNGIQLTVEGEEAAALQINCVYWLDDPEGFARLIEASAGLKVDRTSASRIVLRHP